MQPPLVKQWKCIYNTWDKLKRMTDNRLNKRVFVWSCSNANRPSETGYSLSKIFLDSDFCHNYLHTPVVLNWLPYS